MPMTSQEMIRLLKKNGFIVISQNGSHIKLKNHSTEKTVIVLIFPSVLHKEITCSMHMKWLPMH